MGRDLKVLIQLNSGMSKLWFYWRLCARIKELLKIFFKICLYVLLCLMVLLYALPVIILMTLLSVKC